MPTLSNAAIIDLMNGFHDRADELLDSSQDFNETIPCRRWQGQELADLIGYKSIHNVYLLESSGKVPEWYKEERKANKGYTLEMVMEAMKVNGTLPWRRENEPPVILSFTNFKGGCWKTSTSWHFGSWAASKGYRVLMVDMDPQASLSRSLGLRPDHQIGAEDTLSEVIVGAEDASFENVSRRVLKTHICSLDLIPASLDLQAAEWELAANAHSAGIDRTLTDDERSDIQVNIFLSLAIALETVSDNYDLVILDGTPTLGMLPLNIVFASHSVVVPVPAQKLDFASTKSFLRLLSDSFSQLNERFGDLISLPEPWALVTKFDSTMTTESDVILNEFIRPTFGDRLLDEVIHSHKKAVDIGSFFSRTMFDVSASTLNIRKDARERCMKNFERSGLEIIEKVVYPHWPETRHIQQLKREVENGNIV